MGDSGRVPDGTGLSSSTEPASGLGPSGFDPSRKAILLEAEDCLRFHASREEYAAKHAIGTVGDEGGLRAERCRQRMIAYRQAAAFIADLALPPEHQNRRCADAFVRAFRRDSDGSPKGGDAEGGSVRSTTARAAAQTAASPNPHSRSPSTIGEDK